MYLGIWDSFLAFVIIIYLMPIIFSGIRHYHNGYKPIRWLLLFSFSGLLLVNIVADGFDLDWWEMTDPVRVWFAFGRGAATIFFVGLVWYIKHRKD